MFGVIGFYLLVRQFNVFNMFAFTGFFEMVWIRAAEMFCITICLGISGMKGMLSVSVFTNSRNFDKKL